MIEIVEQKELLPPTQKPRVLDFFLIDGHHHIGDDEEKDHQNLSVRGSFDFFRAIWKKLSEYYADLSKQPEFFQPRFKITKIFPPPPLSFLDTNPQHQNSWFFDQFVAFPFHDKFRAQEGIEGKKINYHSSNKRLSRIIEDPNTGCRAIGYCRLDPRDNTLAINELDCAVNDFGLRGIKLHPLSDGWNSPDYFKKKDSVLLEILRRAMKYSIPVIFDCRYENTLSWIYETADILRNESLDNGFSESYVNQRLKLIIAHIAFLWQNGDFLFKALAHPNIYGDLTGLKSGQTRDLMRNLAKKVICPFIDANEFTRKYYWSTKIILGSDFDYFQPFHIAEQILYFLSQDFYSLIEGNLSILQNIFSQNLIMLLPAKIIPNSPPISRTSKKITGYSAQIKETKISDFISSFLNEMKEQVEGRYPINFRMESCIDHFYTFSDPSSFQSSNFPETQSSLIRDDLFYFEWKNLPLMLVALKIQGTQHYNLYLLNQEKGEIIWNFKANSASTQMNETDSSKFAGSEYNQQDMLYITEKINPG